jgi:hypothetical protein
MTVDDFLGPVQVAFFVALLPRLLMLGAPARLILSLRETGELSLLGHLGPRPLHSTRLLLRGADCFGGRTSDAGARRSGTERASI